MKQAFAVGMGGVAGQCVATASDALAKIFARRSERYPIATSAPDARSRRQS